MGSLSYKEKIRVQLMRNKASGLEPSSQVAIAKKFNLSPVYVSDVIAGNKNGKSAIKWRKKFEHYVGMEGE